MASEEENVELGSRKRAVAHKDYDVLGGGELLAEGLARTFDAPLYVGHLSAESREVDIEIQEIAPNSITHRLMDRGGIVRAVGHLLNWRDNADAYLSDYDTVITSGNEPLWWVPRDTQTVVAYTHSPPRYFYDLYHDVDGLVGRTAVQVQRILYESHTSRPDLWIANSDVVARRIRQHAHIPPSRIKIVYPPVETDAFDPSLSSPRNHPYFVTISRLDRPKSIDEIIRAFNGLDVDLVVGGTGPERERLEKLAGENVHLLGYVSEKHKQRLLAGAEGFIFNAWNEDFGIAPVEAMAAGTPVIGVREGFTKHQVIDMKNGYTFTRGEQSLRRTVKRFQSDGVSWDADRIASFADQFSVRKFRAGMREAVALAEDFSRVTPPWKENSKPVPTKTSSLNTHADGNEE